MEVYVEKGFNWKKFFKIVGIVVGSIVGLFLVLFLFHKVEGTIRGGEITKYEVWKSSTVEKVAEYCDLDLEKVEKVELSFYDPLEHILRIISIMILLNISSMIKRLLRN